MIGLSRSLQATGVAWLHAEFERSIQRVREAVDRHAEALEPDVAPLRRALDELRQVQGGAQMIDCGGLALIVWETAATLERLCAAAQGDAQVSGHADGRADVGALHGALVGATLQLSDYVQGLADGMPDNALILHGAINELRHARGQSILSDAAIFAAQMGERHPGWGRQQAVSGEALAPLVARVLPLYQSALLGWVRNSHEAELCAARLGKIAERLAAAVDDGPQHALWTAATAAIEALLARAVDDVAELKRLFGRLGVQLRLLGARSASANDAHAPDCGGVDRPLGESIAALTWRLAFIAVRSRCQRPRVIALRAQPVLSALTPAELARWRKRIHGASPALLDTVARELQRELDDVESQVDRARRSGVMQGIPIASAGLERVAAMLAGLGVEFMPDRTRTIAVQLVAVASRESDESSWLAIAQVIVELHFALAAALGQTLRRGGAAAEAVVSTTPPAGMVTQGRQALQREILVNLAQLKRTVEAFLKGHGSPDAPDEAQRLLGDIAAALAVVGQVRLAQRLRELTGSIGHALHHMVAHPVLAERFADVIAALEVQLDIGVLRQQVQSGTDAALPALLDDSMTGFLAAVHSLGVPVRSLPPLAVSHPQVTSADSPSVEWETDDEIRGVFLEELAEIELQLQQALSAWLPAPGDADRLLPLRRTFHTLKGSGRTVGATVIGDYGWALENLLNRCLEGALAPGPAIIETVRQAIEAIPRLREAYRRREAPGEDLLALCAHAHALAEGRLSAQDPQQADLLATFRQDVLVRLDALIHALDQPLQTADLDEAVRGLHTVRGAARAVQAEPIAELAGVLEQYLEIHATAQLSPDAQLRRTLQQLVRQLREACVRWGQQTQSGDGLAAAVEQVRQLNRQLPEDAQRAVADRHLARVFANEAFDLIGQMEQRIEVWRQTPSSLHAAEELKVLAHTLGGAALTSGARALGDTAKLLSRQFGACATAGAVPDAVTFVALLEICEGLYQLLDAFREGHATEVAPWLSRAAALPWLAQAEADTAAPVSTEGGAGQVDTAPVARATDEADLPPIPAPDMPFDRPPAMSIDTRRVPAADATGPDPEIYAVFRDEALELLTQMEAALDSLTQPEGMPSSAAPQTAERLQTLQHLLHTFKGAARTCSLPMLGDVAHAMETLLAPTGSPPGDTAADAPSADRVPLGVLQAATDALHGALDALDRGSEPRLGAVLAVLRAALHAPVEPGADMHTPGGPVPTVPVPSDAPDGEPFVAGPQPPATVMAPAARLPEGIDTALLQTFLAEAEDLLETAESSLGDWESSPADYTPARELLRALHSLKGGARMARLDALGDTAHELESLVEGLEYAREPNAHALQVVREALRGIRHRVDRLLAGDYAQLQPVDTSAEFEGLTAEGAWTPTSTPAAGAGSWDPALFHRSTAASANAAATPATSAETARVAVAALDTLLNQAGEVTVFRARLDEQMATTRGQLVELEQAINRLREQLRQLDQETEAQIAARGLQPVDRDGAGPEDGANREAGRFEDRYGDQFDPLEMDRYTRMQELSRALAESIGDVSVIHASLDQLQTQSAALLVQQGRVAAGVQQGLMQTLMVPFSRMAPRLQRLVQQASAEHGKRVELIFEGVESELDRKLYDRIGAPLEHLLRNAVVHGIELPQQRAAQGKPLSGQIVLALRREGAQFVIELNDDGRGLDLDAIRRVAVARGLLAQHAAISDAELGQFIFAPGFSTARSLTQDAGRGVGLDVAVSEIRALGGSLDFSSIPGRGLRFVLRLPLAMVVARALLVEAGSETYAVPVPSIEAVVRLPAEQAAALLAAAAVGDGTDGMFEHAGELYRTLHLADWVGTPRASVREGEARHAILLRQSGGDSRLRRVALVVDRLLGHREIVSKPVGPLISSIAGVGGATLLADGRVVVILDLPGLLASRSLDRAAPQTMDAAAKRRPEILIVDDSITVRRVTERLLERNGYATRSARDGLEAIAMLQEQRPAAILLDIEMPRADGFEVAGFVRNTPALAGTPIIIITSRSGDKHRERAAHFGIARYLVKPYQEDGLLAALRAVLQTEAVR